MDNTPNSFIPAVNESNSCIHKGLIRLCKWHFTQLIHNLSAQSTAAKTPPWEGSFTQPRVGMEF